MTQILLDTIFLSAFQTLFQLPVDPSTGSDGVRATTGKSAAKQNPQEMSFQHSLSPSLTPVGSMLDRFASVYHAMYRYSGCRLILYKQSTLYDIN